MEVFKSPISFFLHSNKVQFPPKSVLFLAFLLNLVYHWNVVGYAHNSSSSIVGNTKKTSDLTSVPKWEINKLADYMYAL